MRHLGENQELRHNFFSDYFKRVQHRQCVSVCIYIYQLTLIYTLGRVS